MSAPQAELKTAIPTTSIKFNLNSLQANAIASTSGGKPHPVSDEYHCFARAERVRETESLWLTGRDQIAPRQVQGHAIKILREHQYWMRLRDV
jgi:hypothetical protein